MEVAEKSCQTRGREKKTVASMTTKRIPFLLYKHFYSIDLKISGGPLACQIYPGSTYTYIYRAKHE
jgi:hypothetical protein